MESNRLNQKSTFFANLLSLAVFFFVLVEFAKSDSTTTDQAQTKYLIPSYYGSRDLDFATQGFAISSNYSSFYWSHGVDIDDQTSPGVKKFYVIDTNEQTIKQITDQFVVSYIASTAGGYRDGDIKNSLFNNSLALAFFRQNKYDAAIARYKQIVVLSSNSAACQANPQSCIDSSLGVNSQIDLSKLAEYYDIPADVSSNLPSSSDYLNEVLIVADTNNHCIRKIDLVTSITTTIAGKCTVSGFLDGPLGTNLMYSPSSLGVDEQGIIFFYDGEYDYIRMIDPITTFVSTLIKGACREDIRYPSKQIFQNMSNRRVICYKNWINVNAEPTSHKYSENLLSICQLQQSLCPTTSPSTAG